MKIFILSLVTVMVLSSSCQKEKCKEQQARDLKSELEQFQREVSNSNLTMRQIEELNKRHEERQKQILAECR